MHTRRHKKRTSKRKRAQASHILLSDVVPNEEYQEVMLLDMMFEALSDPNDGPRIAAARKRPRVTGMEASHGGSRGEEPAVGVRL